MRTTKPLLLAVAVVGAVMFAPQLTRAQTGYAGPSGSYTNTVLGPANAVWDVTSAPDIMNVNSEILDKDGNTTATFSYPINFQQTGAGKLQNVQGANQTTIEFGYFRDTDDTGQWVDVDPFPGTYKITGSIASSRGITRGFFNATATGTTMIAGKDEIVKNRKVKSTQRVDFTIVNDAKTVSTINKDSGSVSGLGSRSSRVLHDPEPLAPWIDGDGTWTLTMTLSTDVKNKVTGSAFVTLDSGATFQFLVKGVYKPKNQLSTLVLTGTDTAKGSNLKVTMNADAVMSLKGKISGQSVSVAF